MGFFPDSPRFPDSESHLPETHSRDLNDGLSCLFEVPVAAFTAPMGRNAGVPRV
jgi:hypothetical protein